MSIDTREADTPLNVRSDPNRNVTDMLERRVQEFPESNIFARRVDGRWQDVTARQFGLQVRALAARLITQGVGEGDRIGVMSATRYEWALIEFAVYYAGAIVVPIYPTSSPEQLAKIVTEARITQLFIETAEHRERCGRAERLLESSGVSIPTVHQLTELDAAALEQETPAEGLAAEVERRRAAPTLDSLATIVYSSGTSGEPKGVRISHGNFVRLVVNIADNYSSVIREDSKTLLFLPLAHVLARGVQLVAIQAGMQVGHLSEPAELLGELKPYQPTFLLVVPRVLEKVENAVAQKAGSGLLGKLFARARTTAIRVAEHQEAEPGAPLPPLLRAQLALFDRLFFSRVRTLFGGKVEILLSGASTLDAATAKFFAGMGLPVIEGYGLTETTAPVTGNLPGKVRYGTVGQPVPGTSVRIAPDGEILVRGIGVTEGYERSELDAEAFRDGFFRTGDLGSLDEDGYLTVTGRAKDLIITSYGKNIAPEPLEKEIARAQPLVAQAVVVGEARPYLAALLSLDPVALAAWAQERRLEITNRDIADIPELNAELHSSLAAVNSLVSDAEQVKRFRVITEEVTEESGYLTPTLKLKRALFVRDFAQHIGRLYQAPRAIPGTQNRHA